MTAQKMPRCTPTENATRSEHRLLLVFTAFRVLRDSKCSNNIHKLEPHPAYHHRTGVSVQEGHTGLMVIIRMGGRFVEEAM